MPVRLSVGSNRHGTSLLFLSLPPWPVERREGEETQRPETPWRDNSPMKRFWGLCDGFFLPFLSFPIARDGKGGKGRHELGGPSSGCNLLTARVPSSSPSSFCFKETRKEREMKACRSDVCFDHEDQITLVTDSAWRLSSPSIPSKGKGLKVRAARNRQWKWTHDDPSGRFLPF